MRRQIKPRHTREGRARGSRASGGTPAARHSGDLTTRETLVRWQILSERAGVAVKVLTAVTGCVVWIALGVLVYKAATSKAVVVEPFDAAPALADRGLTGEVVAGSFLDELTIIQTATRSSAAARDLRNAWTGDIKIEVPQTGVSLSEVERVLKRQFGRDLHIDGALVLTEARDLALTIRGDGIEPKTFGGAIEDLPKLTKMAAEYAYGRAQPALFTTYLRNTARYADAVKFAEESYASTRPEERPHLLNAWANAVLDNDGPPDRARKLYQKALHLKPDHWVAHNNLINLWMILENERQAWKSGMEMRKAAGGRPGRAPELYYQNLDSITWNLLAWRASLVEDADTHGGIGSGTSAHFPVIADIDVRLHDLDSAEINLEATRENGSDPTVAAMTHFVQGRMAAEAGDLKRAAEEMKAFGRAYADAAVSTDFPGYNCWIAPILDAAGFPDEADTVLNAAGRFVDCYRFRGDLLDRRGDWTGARRAYDDAVKLAPELPAAYFSWGCALVRHGDLAGALAKFEQAHRLGPHWADPLKAWGDVLAQQGLRREAIRKYDEALKYAPKWPDLKKARASVARSEASARVKQPRPPCVGRELGDPDGGEERLA